MLIEMKDGGILDITSDTWDSPGCETCDYGSRYVNEWTITMTTGKFYIEIEEMYSYALSEGYMMKLFLNNVNHIQLKTEAEFRAWLEEQVKYDVDSGRYNEPEFEFRFEENPEPKSNRDASLKLDKEW